MSVEQCSSLTPSLKAKLQNAGFLWLRDLCRCAQGGVETTFNVGKFLDDSHLNAAAKRLQQNCSQLTHTEAIETARVVLPSAVCRTPAIRTLRELLDAEATKGIENVTTLCRSLDILLGGGLQVGTLTEICGPPGVGKTQLSMQLAVNCVLPKELGGLQGGCLFIDTEGSFLPERFREIASAAVGHVREIVLQREKEGLGAGNVGVTNEENGVRQASFLNGAMNEVTAEQTCTTSSVESRKRGRVEAAVPPPLGAIVSSFTVDYILQRTQYVRVLDVVSLMALLNGLPAYIASHPGIRMVIIDSIAFPFRSLLQLNVNSNSGGVTESHGAVGKSVAGVDDSTGMNSGIPTSRQLGWQRARLLFRCGQLLQDHARELNLCIVVSNQMATRMGDIRGLDGGFRTLVPALGDSWAYALSTRLLLTHQHDVLHHNEIEKRGEKCHDNMVFVMPSGQDSTTSCNDSDGGSGSKRLHAAQHRVARLIKSPAQPQGQCCFSISYRGVRDVFRPTL